MKPWFKFYKQDYLTDTKLIGVDPLLRLIWVTLMCLADDDGVIDYLKEADLIKMAGCDDHMANELTDYERVKGCLEFFEQRGMIALQTVTESNVTHVVTRNEDVTRRVTLRNYVSRQEQNLSNAERQKKHREKNKIASKSVTKQRNDGNVTQRNDSNARLDKIRLDKNIYITRNKLRDLVKENTKPKERSEKQQVYDRIIKHLEETLGTKIVNYGKQLKAIHAILGASYTEQQILRTITHMATKDDFFVGKGFDMTTVANQIPRYKAQSEQRKESHAQN